MSNQPITIDYTDGAPLGADDPRAAMARSYQAARAVIEQIDDTNAATATPCPEWSTLEVARHLVAVFDRAVAAPTGADITVMPLLSPVDLAGLHDAVAAAGGPMHAAWADDATLAKPINAPWGTHPGGSVLGTWAGETLVHTWDLVVALGLEINWPNADLEMHLHYSLQTLPATGRPDFVPFDDAITLGDDATPIERFAAFLGRDVAAWR